MIGLRTKRVEKLIKKIEQQIGKSIEKFNKDDLALLFRELNSSSMTFDSFKFEIKQYILLNYGKEVPSYALVDAMKFADIDAYLAIEKRYFKNFNTLNRYLNQTLNSISSAYKNAFDTTVASIYMAWSGVPYKMAPDVLKSGISETDNLITLPDGSVVEAGDHIMDFLRHYKDSLYFEVPAKGGALSKRDYKNSVYLLRSNRSDHLTLQSMSTQIRYLETSGDSSVSFGYRNVYKSGIFHRIYMYELKNGDLPYIIGKRKPREEDVKLWKTQLCYDYKQVTQLYNAIEEYYTWVNCFYELKNR